MREEKENELIISITIIIIIICPLKSLVSSRLDSQEDNRKIRCKIIAVNIAKGLYEEAVASANELIQQSKDDIDLVEHLEVVSGYAAVRSGNRDLMRRARQFFKSAKVHKSMINLWLAELHVAACQFDAAKRYNIETFIYLEVSDKCGQP